MKVYIGRYKKWIGPYQIVDMLLPFLNDDKRHNIGSWLSKTPLTGFCQYIYNKRQRKIKVKIHNYDTWSTDHTLSVIILPMLQQLQKTKHGSPFTDDKDVPKHLRSTSAPPKENEYDTDANHEARWDWILGEMIFAFGEIASGTWEDQFHSGEHDIKWVPTEDGNHEEMQKGPNDTHVFDRKGYDKHLARINNGTKLFGKYFMALWD